MLWLICIIILHHVIYLHNHIVSIFNLTSFFIIFFSVTDERYNSECYNIFCISNQNTYSKKQQLQEVSRSPYEQMNHGMLMGKSERNSGCWTIPITWCFPSKEERVVEACIWKSLHQFWLFCFYCLYFLIFLYFILFLNYHTLIINL
jgi:hypothetical protein